MLGAYLWKKNLVRVSLPIAAPLGNLGRGVRFPGNFESYLKEGFGYGDLSL
jgi:hypothetical protein